MKANELMIGDLVIANYKIDEQVYAKIGHLHPRYGDLEHDSIGFIPCASIGHIEQYINDERGINPIPLTEDILKVNGFRFSHHALGGVIYEYPVFKEPFWHETFTYNKQKGVVYWGSCNLRYVHELQHALRLCGLTELADNFKIKDGKL